MVWVGLGWSGLVPQCIKTILGVVGLGWPGLVRVGLGWSELVSVGLGWSNLVASLKKAKKELVSNVDLTD